MLWSSGRVLLMVVGVVTATLSAAPAQSAPATAASQPAADAEEVGRLIRQLGNEDWKARDEAQDALIALGDAALEAVKAAAGGDDPEIRQRAQVILRTLNRPPSKVEGATIVSLSFRDAPLREVYESLFKQANAPLQLSPPDLFDQHAHKRITINLRKVSFWEAFEALEAQTGLTLDDAGMESALQAVRQPRAGEVYRHGPYKIVADLTGGRHVSGVRVYVEPQLRVLGHAMFAEIEAAAGPVVNPPRGWNALGHAALRDAYDPRQSNVFDVRMPPGFVGGQLTHLKGSVRLKIARRERVIELDRLDKPNHDRLIDGQRFIVNLIRPDPGEYLATVIAYQADPPLEGLSKARPTLVDAEGRTVMSPGSSTNTAARRVDFTWRFKTGADFGPPAKLLLAIPIEIEEVTIPFELGHKPPAP